MLLTLLLSSPVVMAAWPDDVSLTSLAWQGDVPATDLDANRAAYEQVVREMGAAIANKPSSPAESLGVNGFEMAYYNTLAFTDDDGDVGEFAPWERVHETGDPSANLWIPSIGLRKGLPMSIDVGVNVGWLSFSRQTVFGGYGRFTPIEGYRGRPDVGMQVGYAGYIGNDQLELGVMDYSGTLSYQVPFGSIRGINNATFSPWVGGGGLITHAQPRLSPTQQQDLGIAPVSGFKNTDAYDPADTQWRTGQLHAGFRLANQGFHFRFAYTWVPTVTQTLNLGIGFTI